MVQRSGKPFCYTPEFLVAVVRQALARSPANQTMGKCPPQEFGGNESIAAIPKFLIGPCDKLKGHIDVLLLVQGVTACSSASLFAISMVILANSLASSFTSSWLSP